MKNSDSSVMYSNKYISTTIVIKLQTIFSHIAEEARCAMCSVSDSALDPRLVTSKLRLTPTTQCKKCPSTEVTV